jgi:hypothetical protein
MRKFFFQRPKPKGLLPSPEYFLQWAGLLLVLFLIANLAGMRQFSSVLNGTVGSTSLDWQTASFLGAAYVMVYLAFVLGAPTLIIGAAILALWRKFGVTKEINDGSKPPA